MTGKKMETTHLTTEELAIRLRISEETLRSWVRGKKIKSIQIGRRHLFPIKEIEDFEERQLRKCK